MRPGVEQTLYSVVAGERALVALPADAPAEERARCEDRIRHHRDRLDQTVAGVALLRERHAMEREMENDK